MSLLNSARRPLVRFVVPVRLLDSRGEVKEDIVWGVGLAELRFERRRWSCLGVSREMEDPFLSCTAEVDCESGEGDLGPERWEPLGPAGVFPLVRGREGT